MLHNPSLTASMCLTAAQWHRALPWGGTPLISDISQDRLWNGCAFWALQDQSQLPSDTAGAPSKAHAHGHSPCRDEASPCAVTWIKHELVTVLWGNAGSPNSRKTLQDIWLLLTLSAQHSAPSAPPHPEMVPSPSQLHAEQQPTPRRSCAQPHQINQRPNPCFLQTDLFAFWLEHRF